jgi:hypothetical protein
MYTNEQMYGLLTKPDPEKISRYDLINKPEPDELYHYGIKGMRWGVRRYQNPDGSLTQEGKRRAAKENKKAYKKANKHPEKLAKYYDKLTPEQVKRIKTKMADLSEVQSRFASVKSANANSELAKYKLREQRRKVGLLATAAFTAGSLTAVAKFLDTDYGKRAAEIIARNAGKTIKNADPDVFYKLKKILKTSSSVV